MNIPFHRPYITEEAIQSVVESLQSGWTTMGHKTIQFEEEFASYLGVSNAVALNSGTSAMHCALVANNIKEGDEVIVPSTTFIATSEVVEYCNAVPVLVDIQRDTHCIDPERIAARITGKTRAIIPVHFAGQPCDMDEITDIAKSYNLAVIEDAAHSLPAWYKGKKVGLISPLTCFSFYATKTLATGEGGMVVTDNREWADEIRVLRLHGMSRDAWKRYSQGMAWKYDVLRRGFKYNTTDINAALGIEQLNKLEWMFQKRTEIAEKYNRAFGGNDLLIPYHIKDDRVSSWHLYPLKLRLEALKITRDVFIEEMFKRGIHTSVHFIPLYQFTHFRNMGYSYLDFPESEWVFNRVVSLPIFPGLKDLEVDYVIDNVLDIVKSNKR